MVFVFLALSFLPACLGAYLIGDFLYWLFIAERTEGQVTGFQKHKNKGQFLPIIRIPDKDGATRAVRVKRIDELLYFLSPAIKGEIKTLLVHTKKQDDAVVFGFFAPIVGAFLILPFLVFLAFTIGDDLFAGRALYILLFLAMTSGAMVVMKFIQKHY